MSEQIWLNSDSLEGWRETGSLGRPVHTFYPQLRSILESELGPATAALLAEPVIDARHNAIDWYTQGAGEATPLTSLPESERTAVMARLLAAYEQMAALAERYRTASDTGKARLGQALHAALTPPVERNVFLVDGQPVVSFWGFCRDEDRDRPKDLAEWRARHRLQPPPPAPAPPPVPAPAPAGTAVESVAAPPSAPRWPANARRHGWIWLALLLLALLVLALWLLTRCSHPEISTRPPDTAEPAGQSLAPSTTTPNAQERHEFANRMTETQAMSGAITITLLWNNRNDLDLIVICPSGERLYYDHPAACGGTLDVDRNAQRELTSRPVENVYWPAGQAPAGTYQVLVNYYARKDFTEPPETAFQVRLVNNGRETFFKGAVAPLKWQVVTEFTVGNSP